MFTEQVGSIGETIKSIDQGLTQVAILVIVLSTYYQWRIEGGGCQGAQANFVLQKYVDSLQEKYSLLVPARKLSARCIKRFCDTRWSSRTSSIVSVVELLPAIMDILEQLSDDSDPKTSQKAEYLLLCIRKFEFVVCMHIAKNILDRTVIVMATLQHPDIDFFEAIQCVELILEQLKDDRANSDAVFSDLYEQILEAADGMNVQENRHRTCGQQTRRQNPDVESTQDYFKVTVFNAYLDQIIVSISERFGPSVQRAAVIGHLLPYWVVSCEQAELAELLKLYGASLPYPDSFPHELKIWQRKWLAVENDRRPKTTKATLKTCSAEVFPNIRTLLAIFAVLPVTVADCERSFSALKRLKTYLRNTCGQERLVGLALMHIYPDIVVDPKVVVERFALEPGHRL